MMNNFVSKNVGQFFIKIKRSSFSVVRFSSAAAKANKELSNRVMIFYTQFALLEGTRHVTGQCVGTTITLWFQGQQVNSDLFMEKKFLAGWNLLPRTHRVNVPLNFYINLLKMNKFQVAQYGSISASLKENQHYWKILLIQGFWKSEECEQAAKLWRLQVKDRF